MRDQPDNVQRLLDQLLQQPSQIGAELPAPIRAGTVESTTAPLVDREAYKRLLLLDPTYSALLVPLVQATEIHPWHRTERTAWLVAPPAGWTAQTFRADLTPAAAWQTIQQRFPALARHLTPHDQTLHPGAPATPASYWWETTPDSLATSTSGYLLVPNRLVRPTAAAAPARFAATVDLLLIPDDNPILLGLLMSRVYWFVLTQTTAHQPQPDDSAPYLISPQALSQLPIPAAPPDAYERVGTLAEELQQLSTQRATLERDGLTHIIKNLTPPGAQPTAPLQRWWMLSLLELCAELATSYNADLPVEFRDEWENWLIGRRQQHQALTETLVKQEFALNQQVYQLCGLTADAVTLLEQQAPIYNNTPWT